MIQTKLRRHNYLVWRSLFEPIFCHYKLTGIVPPPRFLTDISGNLIQIPNLEFDLRYEKDQNIIIWINSTLSEDLIPFTVGVQSARDLWFKLEKQFGGVSRSHIHQLRTNLQSATKGSSSISEYLQRTKEVTDVLAAAGAPVEDHIYFSSFSMAFLMNMTLLWTWFNIDWLILVLMIFMASCLAKKWHLLARNNLKDLPLLTPIKLSILVKHLQISLPCFLHLKHTLLNTTILLIPP